MYALDPLIGTAEENGFWCVLLVLDFWEIIPFQIFFGFYLWTFFYSRFMIPFHPFRNNPLPSLFWEWVFWCIARKAKLEWLLLFVLALFFCQLISFFSQPGFFLLLSLSTLWHGRRLCFSIVFELAKSSSFFCFLIPEVLVACLCRFGLFNTTPISLISFAAHPYKCPWQCTVFF